MKAVNFPQGLKHPTDEVVNRVIAAVANTVSQVNNSLTALANATPTSSGGSSYTAAAPIEITGTVIGHDASGVAAGSSAHVGEMHFHAHGMTNAKEFIRQVAKELPALLKSTGPQFSPASR